MKLQIPKLFKKIIKNTDQIVFYLVIILLIILVVRLVTRNDIQEHFQNSNGATNIYGNRSIKIDSSNVFDQDGSKVDNVRISHSSNNAGDFNNNNNNEVFLLIDLGKTKKIEAIQAKHSDSSQPVNKSFVVHYSNENKSTSFEGHIIKNGDDPNSGQFIMNTNDVQWENLKNEKDRKPMARFIKIIPEDQFPNFQLEIFTTETDSVSQSSLDDGDFRILDEYTLKNADEANDNKEYDVNSSYIKLKFEKNVLINKLILKSKEDSDNWITEYRIKYKNSQTNYQNIINGVIGVGGGDEENHFWFPYLILADEITIVPIKEGESNNDGTGTIEVSGKEPTHQEEDIALRAQERIILADLSRQTDAQPSIYELVEQNTAANQLCQSLKSQEKLNNNRVKLETNQLYLEKLQDQKAKIEELEETIARLEEVRSSKQQVEDKRKIAQLEYQNGIEAKLTDLVKERLDNQKNLKFNVNILDQKPN